MKKAFALAALICAVASIGTGLDVTEGQGSSFNWEYVVLRLVPDGSPMSFSVPHMVFGDNVLPDVRMSSTSGGGVYQLSSNPSFGVQILRYAF